MDEWRNEWIGNLVSFEYGSALRADSRTGSGFGVYGANGVVGRHETALVSGPGIIIGRKGTVGAVRWSDGDFWPIDTTYWVQPLVDVDLRWVFEALSRVGLDSLDSSTGVPGLNRRDAYEQSVLVPPLEEQRRIAEILDTLDEAIQATERVIAKHERIRSGLASDLLTGNGGDAHNNRTSGSWTTGGFRREVRHDSNLPGVLPSGWSVQRLGAIGSFFRGSGGPKRDEVDDGFPCVRYGDLYTFHDSSIRDTRSRISVDRTESYTKLEYGDLLFAGSGETLDEIGKSAVNLMRERAYCGGDVIILRPEIEIIPSFLGYVADSTSSRVQKSRMGSGSTVMHIYSDQLRNLTVWVPPLEEQWRIAEILDTADETIQTNAEELKKLQQLRSGLADDLLSGRVRTVEE